MVAVLGLLLAKVISLSIIALAITGSFISRKWWHIVIVAIIAALINEVILNHIYYNVQFDPQFFIYAMIASGLWASLAFWVRRREYS